MRSGAALAGGLGAALVSMVCNLTIGKKNYEQAWEPLTELRGRSEALRFRMVELLEADTQAYAKVMEAYRLPRDTAEAKAARKEAQQAALRHAADVPLRIRNVTRMPSLTKRHISRNGYGRTLVRSQAVIPTASTSAHQVVSCL